MQLNREYILTLDEGEAMELVMLIKGVSDERKEEIGMSYEGIATLNELVKYLPNPNQDGSNTIGFKR